MKTTFALLVAGLLCLSPNQSLANDQVSSGQSHTPPPIADRGPCTPPACPNMERGERTPQIPIECNFILRAFGQCANMEQFVPPRNTDSKKSIKKRD